MQNLAFARQYVVDHAQPAHRAQMAEYDRVGHHVSQVGKLTVALLDGMQHLMTPGFLIFRMIFEMLRDSGVNVPAEIVEAIATGKLRHFGRALPFKMPEAANDIGHLHAGVIDIVLHFGSLSGRP